MTKPWSEHLKANIIPIIGMVGSIIYFGHTIDSDFLQIQNNQIQSKVFESKTDIALSDINKHLADHDAGIDTLKVEIRELKMDMNYKFQVEELKHRGAGFVTERHTPHGLALIAVK